MLVDTDQRGNQVLDVIKFPAQGEDVALGRMPNGVGDFTALGGTPGKRNN